MNEKHTELDTIMSEHNFMRVGDPVPVNRFDKHNFHIAKHKKEYNTIKDDDTMLTKNYKNILESHIDLHNEYKNAQIK